MPAVETAIAATDAAPTAELVAMIDSVGEIFEFMAAGTGEGLAPDMPEMPEVPAPLDTGAAPAGDLPAPTTAVGGDAAAANAAADVAAAAETAAAAEAVAEAVASAEAADAGSRQQLTKLRLRQKSYRQLADANPNDSCSSGSRISGSRCRQLQAGATAAASRSSR
ncbi:MAG: hypothetical protein ACJ0KI_07930 [Dehalococcoidia bacterium]